MLETFHYPYVKKLTEAWPEHDVKVLYHSDGNYKPALPQLMSCVVDSFYCLEMNVGMVFRLYYIGIRKHRVNGNSQ